MLKRLLASIATAAILVAGSILGTTIPASAANGVWCDPQTTVCFITIAAPSDPAPNPDSNGWTPGAPTCYYENSQSGLLQLGWSEDEIRVFDGGSYQRFYAIIDCGGSTSYWSNTRQCYVFMKDGVWPTRPPGYSEEAGYYGCIMFNPTPGGSPGLGQETNFWSETVPPGLQVLPPGVAAERLISTFALRGIDIGMAPEVNPAWGHRRSYVGVPVWLWVENPQPLTWGPYSETATLGGQTITATARVTSVRWDMGDGGSQVCGGTGTPYTTGYGVTDSPTCGYRYRTTSESQGGDRYTVTATSQWVVEWTSLAGPTGTINLTTSSSVPLEINELQTVNVGG
jgi:hypothetical protein